MMQHAALCDPLSLSAAFAVGMAGSVHCLAMCGGISGALGMRAAATRRAPLIAACYQAGRIGSYALAGAIVGACGGAMQGIIEPDGLVLIARSLAGLVLIGLGIGVLFRWRPLAGLERLGGRLWRHIAPLARAIPPRGAAGAVLLGMLWGWLPCGFIYSMLIFAALTGGAVQAAAMMLFFGLGTVPAVLGAGIAGGHARRLGWARGLNVIAGWLLLGFGALTIAGPLNHVGH